MSTVAYDPSTGWADEVEVVEVRHLSAARLVWEVVRAAWSADVLVVDGAAGMWRDPLAAAVLRRLRPRAAIVMTEITWKRGSTRIRYWLRRIAARAGDSSRVLYGVTTPDEVKIVPRTWGIDPARVFYLPHYVKLNEQSRAPRPVDPMLVFGGGESVRDWPTAIAAARGASFRLVIAARRVKVSSVDLPPNVELRPVGHVAFLDLLRRAAVVLVALEKREDRAAGQQVFLTAMAMGKPTVVTDALGVRSYTADGAAAFLVPPGDAAALRERLEWVLDPRNGEAVARIAERGRQEAERFSPERHVAILLRTIRAALGTPDDTKSPAAQLR